MARPAARFRQLEQPVSTFPSLGEGGYIRVSFQRRERQARPRIPGVGVVTASAIIASIGDGHQFRNGRKFAASR
jgi:hypothetical protein